MALFTFENYLNSSKETYQYLCFLEEVQTALDPPSPSPLFFRPEQKFHGKRYIFENHWVQG